MVKVEIVEEKEDTRPNSPYASSSSSHTGSTDSLDSIHSEPESETLYDRLTALIDIVPPKTRHSIKQRALSTASFLKSASKVTGNLVWIVTTSALLVGLPLALAVEDEAKVVAQDQEILAQQQGAQQMLAGYPTMSGTNPSDQKSTVTAPGF